MGKADRVKLLEEIGKQRDTFVISYITSTRQNLEVSMAMDAVRKVYDHLRLIGKPQKDAKVDLFIHSNGGEGTLPWRLVTLIREYASRFTVLVPYRAFSAATLTALGADEILMHPMGMLGPTDATVTNPFNPENGGKKIGISGEDVSAYIALIKEDVGINHEDELVQTINHLATQVHPLALGNVKRSLSQSRMMASKLLSLHMDETKDGHKIAEIVDKLTSKLFYHGHPINRFEAKNQIELSTVSTPSAKLEELMWSLYLKYEEEMNLVQPFSPVSEFNKANPAPSKAIITPEKTAKVVYIESTAKSDVYQLKYQIGGKREANGALVANVIVNEEGWETE
jgi:hypothetical protein